MTVTHSRLVQAHDACGRRAWSDAYELLAGCATDHDLGPADLEQLAIAAYLTGHEDQSAEAWQRAYRVLVDQGKPERAVRCAFWLGFCLLQRGETSQGGGWVARARDLADQQGLDSVERGYLLVPSALGRLVDGDHAGAFEDFGKAGEFAHRFHDPDLLALARLGQGQALSRMGRRVEGAALLDEAMTAVTSDEVSPLVSGLLYCAVIDECQARFDVRRAREWTDALTRWCVDQPDLVPYRGQCLVHRSELLLLHGSWGEAMTESTNACIHLCDPPHPAVATAYHVRGDLHRLRGDLAAAEKDYLACHASGESPQPGLGLLRLAQGRTTAAHAAIDSALAGADDTVARARLLPAYVATAIEVTDLARARRAAADLRTLAQDFDAPILDAHASYAEGTVLLAENRPREALGPLRRAWHVWDELPAPYEAAWSRVHIARASRLLDDHDTAHLELGAALRTFERLGAAPAAARIAAASAAPSPLLGGRPLTDRELEVLRLVAGGRTNRAVAAELVISERTVERHLANVFAKLDVDNRAGATAAAYEHHLL